MLYMAHMNLVQMAIPQRVKSMLQKRLQRYVAKVMHGVKCSASKLLKGIKANKTIMPIVQKLI
jgi:hypothetical protein